MPKIKIRSYRQIIYFVLGWVITTMLYLFFLNSHLFQLAKIWIVAHKISFLIFLFFVKVFGIVWPPIPGGLVTLGSLPFLVWWKIYIVDFLGSMVGSSIAFYIARRWGMKFVSKIFDKVSIQKLSRLKVRENRQIEAIFMMRILDGSILEVICYGAGLLNVKYRNFLIGSAISHLIFGIPVFYFAKSIISGTNIIINIVLGLTLFLITYYLRERYFHFDE